MLNTWDTVRNINLNVLAFKLRKQEQRKKLMWIRKYLLTSVIVPK